VLIGGSPVAERRIGSPDIQDYFILRRISQTQKDDIFHKEHPNPKLKRRVLSGNLTAYRKLPVKRFSSHLKRR
jgi:hypothetical protein